MNIERPTSNVEWEKMKSQTYDLEERLLEYSVRIIKIVEQLPNTRAGNHVAGQLLRSGTSPYPNHGEAQAAESPKDFVHKLRISLKELRETQRWLKLIQRVPLIKKPELLNEIRLQSGATSLFDVQRWTFDVRCSVCSTLNLKTTLYGIHVTCGCLQNKLALMGRSPKPGTAQYRLKGVARRN
jgi:four helix bundle protein